VNAHAKISALRLGERYLITAPPFLMTGMFKVIRTCQTKINQINYK